MDGSDRDKPGTRWGVITAAVAPVLSVLAFCGIHDSAELGHALGLAPAPTTTSRFEPLPPAPVVTTSDVTTTVTPTETTTTETTTTPAFDPGV